MPQVAEQSRTRNLPYSQADDYTSVFYDGVYYPEEREDDTGESSIHIKLLANLLSILKLYFKNRQDVFLSGNMNLYFEKGNSRRWFAPDLLVAFGVPNVERSSYLLFREKVFPQVIFEIASEKTWRNDVDEKLRTYEQYGAEEYYVLDPEYAYLSAPLIAYRRENDKLSPVPIADDRIFSPRLGLEIVWEENSFRLFDPNANEFLRTLEESETARRIAETEVERLKAQLERLKAQK
jgi:Uma2 family endonuclease